jgi:hypothetical protein
LPVAIHPIHLDSEQWTSCCWAKQSGNSELPFQIFESLRLVDVDLTGLLQFLNLAQNVLKVANYVFKVAKLANNLI